MAGKIWPDIATMGAAPAEVIVSGTGRMGIIADSGDADSAFTSRIRIIFTASGESDSSLSFGAPLRNDQSGIGNTENGGSVVCISGTFCNLSMGDVDGASDAAVGQVDAVGPDRIRFSAFWLNGATRVVLGGGYSSAEIATGSDDAFDLGLSFSI